MIQYGRWTPAFCQTNIFLDFAEWVVIHTSTECWESQNFMMHWWSPETLPQLCKYGESEEKYAPSAGNQDWGKLSEWTDPSINNSLFMEPKLW